MATPDGHRAPIADQLLHVRSVVTQTPCGGGASSTGQSVIGRRWPRDDITAGSSPLSATTTVLPVVPCDNDDDPGDLDSDDDSEWALSCTKPQLLRTLHQI